ncbi:GIN domain-containing protein [Mucilaginibacter sp.]|uniref:GIN domain-containing protein n=1 Tax=Mucilaginibacter sp. TaxID=1882438 RepID=UPI000EADA233
MKTTILTIAASLVLALGVSTAANAATKIDNGAAVVLNNVSKISKIEVRGNVEVYVSAGENDNVKVYNKYYSESALVQNNNGTLRITSYKNEKLVVWVTANDLKTINAYDNAEVKSFGKLTALDLSVNLYNNASAKLNVDAYAATVNVNDKAKAEFTGTADVYTLNHTRESFVNNNAFAAVSFTDKVTNAPAKYTVENDLAGL